MSKLERLREALTITEFPHDSVALDGSELRGLLKVCDEYVELSIAYNEVAAHNFGMMTDRDELEKKAREKLEELLG